MDKIDEWMKRVDEDLETISSTKLSEKAHPKKKQPFNKKEKKDVRMQPHKSKHSQPNKQKKEPYKGSHKPAKMQGHKPAYKSAHTPAHKPTKNPRGTQILRGQLKVIPLGGLNEVGKNMMAIEYENDIIVVDMGFEFPSEDLLGIDYVIPDVSYLEENRKRIRGVFITHGHLDHTGGIAYILPKLDFPPVYTLRLTKGLIDKRLEEFELNKTAKIHEVKPGETIKSGRFSVKFLRVAHSIPDAAALEIDTPVGKIIHTGDFKFDDNPAGIQEKADVNALAQLGKKNVLALFCDSTNALEHGHTMSEREVGETLEKSIAEAKGRVVIASFSSLIGRIQQIINYGIKHKRKIFVSGRSMLNNIEIAVKLGYLKFPANAVQDIKKYKKVPDNETLILTTGSQGESMSALTRIAMGSHPHIKVKKGDTIILSASPIIGNERAIFSVINALCIQGANVVHNKEADIHTSGHAKQEEILRMIRLVKPKYFIPVHGEYFMRQGNARLAKSRGNIPANHIFMLQNGDVLLASKGEMKKSDEKVETKYILIDGSGEGQMDSPLQLERSIMSRNGALVILIYINKKSRKITKTPDVVSRGYVYMHESEEITKEITRIAEEAYKKIIQKNPGTDRNQVKRYVKQTVDKYTNSKLERRPLIIPLIIES